MQRDCTPAGSSRDIMRSMQKSRKSTRGGSAAGCGHIYDLKCPEAIKQVENLEMDGHQVSEVHYYYKGICKNCLSKDKETRID